MTVRAQYSLKELLYWLTVWCVALCVLSAVTPKALGVFVFAIWFIGTTVANRVFRYRAGFVYASLVGAIFWLLEALLFEYQFKTGVQPHYDRLIILVPLFGLISGSIVWLVAVGFDRLYRLLSSSE